MDVLLMLFPFLAAKRDPEKFAQQRQVFGIKGVLPRTELADQLALRVVERERPIACRRRCAA